jgi:MFS family permease
MMLDGLTYALVYYCRSLQMLMALIALHALAIPMIVVPRTALIQEWVAPERRGRAFSLIGMAVVGMTALSNAATGWLAENFGIDTIFGVFGLSAMLCGVIGWGYQKLRAA